MSARRNLEEAVIQNLPRQFLEIIAELEKVKPITVSLSAAEAHSIISVILLAKITMPGFDSYVKMLREKLNKDYILSDLRDSKPIVMTLSAVEGFCVVTIIRLFKVDDNNSIILILAEEAGQKIQNSLFPP